MAFLGKLLHLLQAEMPTPTNYGWYHLLCIAVVTGFTVWVSHTFQNASDRAFRKLILVFWSVILVLEVYKQLVFGLEYQDGAFIWDCAWYSFPFQFCSTPLYMLPLVIWLPDGKVRDAVMGFLCFFSFFGGLAVMCYPNDVFIGTIGINIQTMVHHGLQVTVGILLAVRNRDKLALPHFLRALPVFLSLLGVALLMNVSVYHIFQSRGIPDDFNMFYISPYFPCHLPILSSVYENAPYPVFLLFYAIGFSLVALLMLGLQKGVWALQNRWSHEKKLA